jgi:hypothetical protein
MLFLNASLTICPVGAAVLSWPKLRALGVGFWLTEPAALRSTAEALAKAQFAATKDAHEPALMYAALGKKAVLQGLFRSSGNKKVRCCCCC